MKRFIDILFSSFAFLCGAPIFLFIAILIKCTSKGPVFYCSRRLGYEGKPFTFYKYRSMYTNADAALHEILRKNPEQRKEWKKYCKLKEDPRLTPIGKFLRKHSLDELPQFFNVLKGDLTLVGPRPYLPQEWEIIKKILGPKTLKLFSLKPGLTGIWQTSGRNWLSFKERLFLDLEYIEKRSLAFDMHLIAKTALVMLFPRGAF
jgi:exopolysaccharide production protein ExoY